MHGVHDLRVVFFFGANLGIDIRVDRGLRGSDSRENYWRRRGKSSPLFAKRDSNFKILFARQ
jgi:hypothetical protein